MAKLVLVRHGKSEWNEKGLWTGWTDVPLCEKGYEEAKSVGLALRGLDFDFAFIAPLVRNRETLKTILNTMGENKLDVIENSAILERNYGIYTGKNKWQVKEEVGEEEFMNIRRGWNHLIPEGESLKQVYNRFIPYYQKEIELKLKTGKNILVVSSGNALRSLVKYLENLGDEEISKVEIGTAEILKYEINDTGEVIGKEILNKNLDKLGV